jgi:hypothetical protein
LPIFFQKAQHVNDGPFFMVKDHDEFFEGCLSGCVSGQGIEVESLPLTKRLRAGGPEV